MIHRALAACALVSGILLVGGVVHAQAPDPVAARNALMKDQGRQLYGVINRMNRGTIPFDQAQVDAAFAALEADVAKATALYKFKSDQPAPSSQFRPLLKIWDNQKDFEDRFIELTKVLAENKSKVSNLDDLKLAFGKINKVCSDCHDLYQVKN
jgi:cytochrome c556